MTIIVSGGGGREVLSAARSYYVRTDGSDSNNGLANTAGGAFLTVQAAINATYALDFNSNTVTINIADGTYAGAITVGGPRVGIDTSQRLVIQGNTTTPTNVVLSHTATLLTIADYADVFLKGVQVTVTGGTACIFVTRRAQLWFNTMDFGAATGRYHLMITDGAFCSANGNYTISGGAAAHVHSDTAGEALVGFSKTVTLSGTPAFSTAFADATIAGIIETSGNTYSGAATGTRYSATQNSVISTGGGGANYFPGNAAGSTATGGQYV